MQEITRKHERKQTSGLDTPRTGFSRRTLLTGVVGALGLLLTGKALAEEPAKPKQVAEVGKKPVGLSEVEGTKRMQGRNCSTATTMEDLQKFDEETSARGYRKADTTINEGMTVMGRMTNGRKFYASFTKSNGVIVLSLMVGKVGTDEVGRENHREISIPLNRLDEAVVSGMRVIVEDRSRDEDGGYFQVYGVSVDSHGAKPDYNRTSLPFILVGLDLRTDELGTAKGTICKGTDLTLAPHK